MPSAITDWGTGQLLGMVMGTVGIPANYYAALCTDEPGTDTDGTLLTDIEPDPAFGYTRVAITTGNLSWTSSDGTAYSTNINPVNFPSPTGSWGTCSHFALCSAAVDGEVYLYGEFDLPTDVDASTAFNIPAGGIVIAFGSAVPSIVAV